MRTAVTVFAADCGIGGIRLEDVRACVSEAVTNAIVHAYRDGRPPGTVETRAEFTPQALTVTVIDDGMGFRPRNDSPGVGLGMPTIAALATTLLVVTPQAGGTEVQMIFALDP